MVAIACGTYIYTCGTFHRRGGRLFCVFCFACILVDYVLFSFTLLFAAFLFCIRFILFSPARVYWSRLLPPHSLRAHATFPGRSAGDRRSHVDRYPAVVRPPRRRRPRLPPQIEDSRAESVRQRVLRQGRREVTRGRGEDACNTCTHRRQPFCEPVPALAIVFRWVTPTAPPHSPSVVPPVPLPLPPPARVWQFRNVGCLLDDGPGR